MPFVKWAGGKGRLLAQLDRHVPAVFGHYVEPFVGGGALFFHLSGQGKLAGKEVVLIDSLPDLVDAYRVVRDRVEELIGALAVHEPRKLNRDYYYQVRGWDREPGYGTRGEVERAARLLFLNHTCYNGLYRVNRRGQVNVPFGAYRNPRICDAANLRAASHTLAGTRLLAADFERCLEVAGPRDLVYLDPPYHPLSATASFTSYTAGSFGSRDQQRLADLFRALHRRGCHVLLSNSDTPLIRELYAGFRQIEVQAPRAINTRGDGRGAIGELLVLNC